jgi:hypothetical protein
LAHRLLIKRFTQRAFKVNGLIDLEPINLSVSPSQIPAKAQNFKMTGYVSPSARFSQSHREIGWIFFKRGLSRNNNAKRCLLLQRFDVYTLDRRCTQMQTDLSSRYDTLSDIVGIP